MMIPDYLAYFRYQDKRLIPYLYVITFMLLGFYWKNNGYTFVKGDAVSLSIVLSLIAFNFIYELRGYWAYKCVVKKIDASTVPGNSPSRYQAMLLHPLIGTVLCWVLFYLIVSGFLQYLSPGYVLPCIALASPALMYLIFRFARFYYVRQMKQAVVDRVKYRNLHCYAGLNLLLTILMSALIISPLRVHDDFSLLEGFFSARLMVAMLILCAIVLAINLMFIHPSRRYAFLGRLFLQEIDFNFSASLPLRGLYDMPLWARLIVLLIIESLWLIIISAILSLVGWHVYFEIYYLLCIVPAMIYYYLHIYWRWHNDYLMACDMYLRWGVIDKQTTLW
ncbi:hypothetical protein [Silvania hatchlandensis]|uniref:Inner membrane protein n=1 Tax=Silvania hatchlandensis TaxID=2926469 RepID=A0A9J6Q1M6_9ENTR|nr:hypothetical protein [Silvania hatchlandensis]MCU6663138.1 hypothetical protein [Silvania hatchlandensis]